ncbi:hypothetical protein GCM10023187_53250 [Nibrella viscosa]|uniref:Protein kinase domain-containing protein n=1 Tax=Nibrella viscosa TaxID=1084524 RepID=A0ABP8KZ39_9BACT
MEVLNGLKYITIRGAGYFCNVKLYEDEKSKIKFAVKELKKEHYQNDEYRYRLLREVELLKDLQGCENIIELIDSGNDREKEKLWYMMPFADFTLYDYIKRNNSTLNKGDRYAIVDQVIQAIKYAHNKNIVHRDISANNVLVFIKNGQINIKVSDFGLGKDTESISHYTKSSASGYGQILYVSPEQRTMLKSATVKSDIYSLGKLVYFILTGKDPDNLKQCELSSLISKSVEENPENRFNDISDFENHYNALKRLQFDQEIPIEYITLHDLLQSKEEIDWVKLHQFMVMGTYTNHVYDDYIEPVNTLLLRDNNLYNYYQSLGSNVRSFVNTYSERLDECYGLYGWPFDAMNTFGEVLFKLVRTVNDDETRLICLKQLWHLAFEADRWKIQSEINTVFNKTYIPESIQTQLAEYITSKSLRVDMKHFSSASLPRIVKIGIINANQIADRQAKEREQALQNEENDFPF